MLTIEKSMGELKSLGEERGGVEDHIQYTHIILPITEKILSVNISYKYLLTS